MMTGRTDIVWRRFDPGLSQVEVSQARGVKCCPLNALHVNAFICVYCHLYRCKGLQQDGMC